MFKKGPIPMKSLFCLKRSFTAAAASLAGSGLPLLAGCASSMVPANTQRSDSGITSVIQEWLDVNDKIKAGQVGVGTREGHVYLTGVRVMPSASHALPRVSTT